MFFPTPSYTPSQMPSHSRNDSYDHAADPLQWEKFDKLFDQVFGPTNPPPPANAFAGHGRLTGPSAVSSNIPGGFHRGGAIGEGPEADLSEEEDFDKLWMDALKRVKRTTTTTTKQRIIRHTPEMDMPFPVPMSKPAFVPRSPFPQLKQDHSSDQSDSDTDSNPPAPTTPFRERIEYNGPAYMPGSSPSGSSESSSSSTSSSPRLRREKSKFSFRESPDSTIVTAMFEMPTGLSKEDLHVSFSTTYGAERVTVSWQSVTIAEMIEAGKLVRERKERKFARTLPLPLGTKFEHVKASFHGGVLSVVYPKHPTLPMETIRTIQLQ